MSIKEVSNKFYWEDKVFKIHDWPERAYKLLPTRTRGKGLPGLSSRPTPPETHPRSRKPSGLVPAQTSSPKLEEFDA